MRELSAENRGVKPDGLIEVDDGDPDVVDAHRQ
jgi:hypothetical protein